MGTVCFLRWHVFRCFVHICGFVIREESIPMSANDSSWSEIMAWWLAGEVLHKLLVTFNTSGGWYSVKSRKLDNVVLLLMTLFIFPAKFQTQRIFSNERDLLIVCGVNNVESIFLKLLFLINFHCIVLVPELARHFAISWIARGEMNFIPCNYCVMEAMQSDDRLQLTQGCCSLIECF